PSFLCFFGFAIKKFAKIGLSFFDSPIILKSYLEINERLLLFFTVGQPLAWQIRFFAATM
ncbi:hypothetical protein, partial [Xenorhabdus stockiae]|uniref:hypothetical protein n=1 Tax=Xenorhabdus stockiae TaxID=351614 RepID=UPI001B801229